MTNHLGRILILTLVVFSLMACKTNKNMTTTEPSSGEIEKYSVEVDSVLPCDHSARIVLDIENASCGLMLTLPNGMSVQPIELPDPEFTFSSGDKVRVSFVERDDFKSDCANSQGIVQVTCLEKDWNLSYDKGDECVKTIDAFSIPWMKRIIGELDPEKVTRYDFEDRLAYKFEGKKGQVVVDCFGQELCRQRPGEKPACEMIQSMMSNAYVILVINN